MKKLIMGAVLIALTSSLAFAGEVKSIRSPTWKPIKPITLPSCIGTGVKSCSRVGATSATCGSYYLDGDSSMQCKWGSYCTAGGASCIVR